MSIIGRLRLWLAGRPDPADHCNLPPRVDTISGHDDAWLHRKLSSGRTLYDVLVGEGPVIGMPDFVDPGYHWLFPHVTVEEAMESTSWARARSWGFTVGLLQAQRRRAIGVCRERGWTR